jgi:hypothetical protein
MLQQFFSNLSLDLKCLHEEPFFLNLYKGRRSLLEQVGFRHNCNLAFATSSIRRQSPETSLGNNARSVSPSFQNSRYSNWCFLSEDYGSNTKQI